jgi:hypothetical protein
MGSGGSSKSAQRTAGIVVMSVGLGALIGGGVLGGLAIAKNKDALKDCRGNLCSQQGLDLTHTALIYAHASTGLLVAGGVLAGVGVTVLATSFGGSSGSRSSTGELFIAPSVGAGTLGATLLGTF